CRSVNRDSEFGGARLLQLWAECCELAGVRRACRILQFDGVSQPAIMGVLRPTLLLPASGVELEDEQLRMVMLHELAHVRRGDIAVNWALVAIRAIQWWNPVYWLAASRMCSLREQACDAFVVRRRQSQVGQRYASLLLTLAERRPMGGTWRVMLPASILSFFPSLFRRRAVRVRLKALRTATVERGRWQSAGIATLLVGLAVCGFTVAREEGETEKPMDLPTWMASHPEAVLATPQSLAVKESYAGPQETREYEVTKVLKAVQEEVESDSVGEKGGMKLDPQRLLEITLRQMYGVERSGSDITSTEHYGEHQNSADPKVLAKTVIDSSPPTFKVTGTTLSVTAPAGLHDALRRLLEAWGESGMEQIVVETRFLNSKRDLVSDLGVSWQFLEAFSAERENSFPAAGRDGLPVVHAEASVDEYLPLVVSTLNKQQTDRLIDIAQSDRRTNVLNAPKITIFNGMEAMIADCAQRPFVIGVFQRVAGATEPKIVVLEEGTKIKVRAVVGPDRRKVHVEASVDMKSMGDVTTASTLYRGSRVSIQVPSVKRRSIDVTADVERGQTLLVGCIPTGKEQPYSYYLLSARTISDPAKAAK
ncbi:MAG TPA: M56 family metallopeptidase, partial [Lacipirellulaceae bacterium]|nr:M56 family metallopeptidase [Lacipirellulaceae bacterium]